MGIKVGHGVQPLQVPSCTLSTLDIYFMARFWRRSLVQGTWGVDISNNLSWNTHVNRVASNANRSLGFIKRNVKTKSPKIREMTYQTLVRSQLEYASTIKDPHTQQYTHKIEMVQRRAARWTMNDYARTTSVTSLLHQLGCLTLEERRSAARFCLFYKIVNGLVAMPLPEYIQPTHKISRYCHLMIMPEQPASLHCCTSWAGKHLKRDDLRPVSVSFTKLWMASWPCPFPSISSPLIKYPGTAIQWHFVKFTLARVKYSFFPLAIEQWNAFPESVVISSSLDSFKASIGELQHPKP